MNGLTPMSERVKFERAFGMVRLYQKHIPAFVEHRLGYRAALELNSVWQAGITPIRESDLENEKYRRAYSNWLWMAHCCHDFLADLLDREAVADYKRQVLKIHKQQPGNPDLAIYRMLKSYTDLIKAWAYEMQWITPFILTSQNSHTATCMVYDCKLLHTPGAERVCRVDCRNIGTVLAKEMYGLQRVTALTNKGCTITLTPM